MKTLLQILDEEQIDVYRNASALYSGPFNPSQCNPPGYFGMITPREPFQGGYDMPGTTFQLHLHGPDETTISYGRLYDYSKKHYRELSGYEASVGALRAELLKFRKF